MNVMASHSITVLNNINVKCWRDKNKKFLQIKTILLPNVRYIITKKMHTKTWQFCSDTEKLEVLKKKCDRHLFGNQQRQLMLSEMRSKNNMTRLFFTSENIVSFHCVKIFFYVFWIYTDFTACNK